MDLGLGSLPHQQWYFAGSSAPMAELQPGHLHDLSSAVLVWFEYHFPTQVPCVTVQQIVQDHTREFGSTSLVQMTHS